MARQSSEFAKWMRTGRTGEGPIPAIEVKFNANHDERGRFTFAGHGTSARRSKGPAKRSNPQWRTAGRMSPQEVEKRAANAMRMYQVHRARGMSPEQAAGWAANAEAESNSDYRKKQGNGEPGRGLFQWGSKVPKLDRRRDFEQQFGHSIEQSTEAEQLQFRDWELAHGQQPAARKIARAKSAGDIAAAITIHYEAPKHKFNVAADRANIAEAILRLAKKGH